MVYNELCNIFRRTEWNELPPVELERKLRRRERSLSPRKPIVPSSGSIKRSDRSRSLAKNLPYSYTSSENLIKPKSTSSRGRSKSRESDFHSFSTPYRESNKKLEKDQLSKMIKPETSTENPNGKAPGAQVIHQRSLVASPAYSLPVKSRPVTPASGILRRKSPQRVR